MMSPTTGDKPPPFYEELMVPLVELLSELYPEKNFEARYNICNQIIKSKEILSYFLTEVRLKNAFSEAPSQLDTRPGLLEQISHLLSAINDAKRDGVIITAPQTETTPPKEVTAPTYTEQSASVASAHSKGEDTLIQSPTQRDPLNVRYVEYENLGKDVVIADDGLYKFPKRPEDENERKFYLGEHVQYQQLEGATKYHGYLLGPTKDDFSCVTIMDESTGQLFSNIWPCFVELSV